MKPNTSLLQLNAFVVVTLLLLPAQAYCDDGSDPRVRQFLSELREQRATFERYIVNCVVKSSDLPEYPKGLKITYQVSNPDDYWVVVFDYSGSENNSGLPTRWLGRTDQCFLSGKVGTVSRLDRWPEKFDPMKTVPHFDVMGLGFGFLGELKFGTRFNKIIENYSEYPSLQVADKDDIALLYSPSGRPRIIIDKERGSWPIKSDLAHAMWKIKLKEFEILHAPIWFEFTVLDNRKQPAGKITADLDWETINRPFIVGRDAAAAIADRYGCEFEDHSQIR